MRKSIIFAVILVLSLSRLTSHAQVLPVYFKNGEPTQDKNEADSYGVTGKLSADSTYTLKIFNLYNELMQIGSYKDQALTMPHGVFTFYGDIDYFNVRYGQSFPIKDKARFVSEIGVFNDGLEEGRWLIFYPDGNLMNEQTYKAGILNGPFITYGRKGQILIKGNYVDGKKNGDWMFNGRRIETYVMDELVKKGTATKIN